MANMQAQTLSPARSQGLKTVVQQGLRRLGWYHRLKSSPLYSLYWSLADRRVTDHMAAELHFYKELLGNDVRQALIFDIGANQGYKTATFLRMGARVVAVDPDEVNQKILEESFLKYRRSPKPVTIVPKAVSDKNATETIWIDEPGSAKNSISPKWVETLRQDQSRFGHTLAFAERKQVTTVTLDSLIAQYGEPLFVKIDVEGHEFGVLQGLHKPVPFVSFEVNLPDFQPEGLQCIERLAELAPAGRFNYCEDCSTGLRLKEWLSADRFAETFNQLTAPSIEVFWRTI